MNNKSKIINNFMSDIVVFSKYASIIQDEHRKQTWEECVRQYQDMLLRDHPELTDEINKNFQYVYDKKVFPSMRAMQYGGDPISFNPSRIYNCSAIADDDVKAFSEIMWILLSGAGVGHSVQHRHVDKLPVIQQPVDKKRFLISDSIEGWADAIRMLMYAYMRGNPYPEFDYRDIRPEGSLIKKLNCLAPGSKKLEHAIKKIDQILKYHIGRKLTPLAVMDIVCHIGDSVVSGGVRSSAIITLFDRFEEDIINAKGMIKLRDSIIVEDTDQYLKVAVSPANIDELYGQESAIITINKDSFYDDDYVKNRLLNDKIAIWYELHPHRANSNNSIIVKRGDITEAEFNSIMDRIWSNGSGEPAIYWTDDYDMLTNPCVNGDTMVLTALHGYQPIKDLYKTFGYKKYDPNANYEDYSNIDYVLGNGITGGTVPYLTSGRDNLYEVTFSDGSMIKVTHNHNIVIGNTKKPLHEVRVGDVTPITLFDGITPYNNRMHGCKQSSSIAVISPIINRLGSVIEEDDYSKTIEIKLYEHVADLFDEAISCNLVSPDITINKVDNYTEYIVKINKTDLLDLDSNFSLPDLNSDFNDVVKFMMTLPSRDTVVKFLRSYFTINSNINITIDNATLSTWSDNIDVLRSMQSLLRIHGVNSDISLKKHNDSNVNKIIGNNVINEVDGYVLKINGYRNIHAFMEEIGLMFDYKPNLVKHLLYEKHKAINIDDTTAMVVGIKYIGQAETYCLSIPNHNVFVANGVTIGNCGEIALRSCQFCNLTTTNVYDVKTQEELNERVRVASFLGTLQATYTNFHYLRPIWRHNSEEEALLGVSMTGMASGHVLKLNIEESANIAVEENKRVAKILGINPASRVTTIKPEGSSTLVAGVFGAGIHSAYNEHYIRNIRVKKSDPLYTYLKINIPPQYLEDDYQDDTRAVLSIPMKADPNCIFRHEPAMDLLERIKKFHTEWITPGHISGNNTHNVSCTVSVKEHEIDDVKKWMWDNKHYYNGITILPYWGGTYKQLPYIDITEDEYNEMLQNYPDDLDLTKVWVEGHMEHSREASCMAGGCDITSL